MYPVTQYNTDGERVTVYAFVPAYALTICKAQGQTLDYVVLWFDVLILPPGTAYVTLSRVRRQNSLSFLIRVYSQQFVPVRTADAVSVTYWSSALLVININFSSRWQAHHIAIKDLHTCKAGAYGSKTPEETGVSFFQHFPSNVLRPYGIAYEFPKAQEAFSYLKPFTCEWLKRPEYAMSEMSDSITANLDILAESDCTVLGNRKVVQLMETNKGLLASMVRINHTNHIAPVEQDVYNVLHFLQHKKVLTTFLENRYQLGQAMYLMGVHFRVANLIVTHLKEYTGVLQSTTLAATTFKKI